MRRGAPRLCVIDVAATASVGEMMAPRANAAAHGKPGIAQCAIAPTTSVVRTTNPSASPATGRRLRPKSRHEVCTAATNKSGGKNSVKTASGANSTAPNAGTKESANPPNNSKIAGGIFSAPAARTKATTAKSSTITISSGDINRVRRKCRCYACAQPMRRAPSVENRRLIMPNRALINETSIRSRLC